MRGIFSQDRPETFRCMNCGEVINTSLTECGFCGVTIDHEAALAAADFQKTFDNACTEARTLRIMSLMLVAFYAASWLPLYGDHVGMYFFVLFILVPVMLGRWWMVYHRFQPNDENFRKAQRNVMIAMIVWGAMGGVWLAVVLIRTFLMAGRYSD